MILLLPAKTTKTLRLSPTLFAVLLNATAKITRTIGVLFSLILLISFMSKSIVCLFKCRLDGNLVTPRLLFKLIMREVWWKIGNKSSNTALFAEIAIWFQLKPLSGYKELSNIILNREGLPKRMKKCSIRSILLSGKNLITNTRVVTRGTVTAMISVFIFLLC